MANIKVKIAFPKAEAATRTAGLNVGDSVILHTGTYASDPTAIEVVKADGTQVGFVAARKVTANGYPLAKDIFDDVKDGMSVKIVELSPDLLVEIPKGEAEAAASATVEYISILGGNKMQFPNRMKVAAALRKSNQLDVAVELKDEQVILSYDGVPCGTLSPEVAPASKAVLASKGITVTPTDEIIDALRTAKTVKATAEMLDGIIVPVRFTLEMPVTTKSAAVPASKNYTAALKSFSAEDAAEIQKRVDWLKNYNVAEYAIALFIKRMQGRENIRAFEPCYIPHGKEVENALTFSAVKGNLLLVGPAGSGKNMFILTMASLLDLNLIDKTCSAGVDEEALFGYLSMKASDDLPDADAINAAFKAFMKRLPTAVEAGYVEAEASAIEKVETVAELDADVDYSVLLTAMRSNAAQIEFEPSVLTKALETPSIINLDEVNTLRPTVTSALHSALDKRRNILVNGYKNIEIHPDVIFVATMNEGQEYGGTTTLNLAFEDRWHVIEFEAPDSIIEILKQEVPALPNKAAKVLNDLYKKLKAVRGIELQERSFSQRAFIYAAENIALGNDVKSAIMATIVPKIRDVEDREAVKSIVDMMIK